MLKVERLNLRLPPGYAPRAETIARLVGDELRQYSWNTGLEIATLRLPPLRLPSSASDREVAQALAAAIVHGIHGELRMIAGASGNWSGLRAERGMLIEYISGDRPLVLPFEFNPASITRSRSVTVKAGGTPGNRGGYDFSAPSETARAAQGVSVNAETLSIKILLDATDRMDTGDQLATTQGVQPELDVIRSMLEPKIQAPEGARTLAALGQGDDRAFSRQQFASVLLFKWGVQLLPVFMTAAQIDVKQYLPTLIPYRAEATLNLQIIESRNPFYEAELKRQFALAKQSAGLTQPYTLGG